MRHRFLNSLLVALLALMSLAAQAQNKTHNILDTLFPVAQKGYKKITVYVQRKQLNLLRKVRHLKSYPKTTF